MEKLYKLSEAEALTGTPATTYRTQLNRGHIKGVKVGKEWRLPGSVLKMKAEVESGNPYHGLMEAWKAEQANGLHTGKPLGHRVIGNNADGMAMFWAKLGKQPALDLITPSNLALAITSYQVDYENRRCFYASKDMIYKAVISFCKLLIRKNLMPEIILSDFKANKPKRKYPPRKTVLSEDALERFLEANQKLEGGRSDFDVTLGNVIIGLMAFAGLRRDEVIHLCLSNINLQNGIIRVIHAKGDKPRLVGINERLEQFIREWLDIRPVSSSPRLLLKENGEPITVGVVRHRVYRLAKSNGFDITPHGLRRTFATINSNRGVELDKLRLNLGHSKLETTQEYLMTDELEAAAAVRGPRRKIDRHQAIQHHKQKLMEKLQN